MIICFFNRNKMQQLVWFLFVTLFLVGLSAAVADINYGSLLREPRVFAETEKIVKETRSVLKSSHGDTKRQASTSNVLRIGQLKATSGGSSPFSFLQMHAWELWFARNPTLTIGGQTHEIELIVYIDSTVAGEPANTTAALSEWLVVHDKVHILSTGMQGNSLAMMNVAETLQVPCINSGDYSASFLPPFKWTLYLLPKLQGVGAPCVQALMAKGAKTFVRMSDPNGFLDKLYVPTVRALGGNITGEFNITAAMWKDPSLYDPIIEQIKLLNPDVVMGSASEGEDAEILEVQRVQRMHRLNLNPSSILSWAVGSYPVVRSNLTWQGAGLLIAEAYQPALNTSDPIWGNSRQYDSAYRDKFGIPTTNNDAALAGAITMLVVGLNNSATDLSSPSSILTALNTVNTSSIFGPLFFVNNTVQRTVYCFQNTFPNSTDVATVWPPR